jgi:hypothetical protein
VDRTVRTSIPGKCKTYFDSAKRGRSWVGEQSVSSAVGTEGSSPGMCRPEREADPSGPCLFFWGEGVQIALTGGKSENIIFVPQFYVFHLNFPVLRTIIRQHGLWTEWLLSLCGTVTSQSREHS